MSTTSLTQQEFTNVLTAYTNYGKTNPALVWQLLASYGDQYASAAYIGLTQPASLYGEVIIVSNTLAGVTGGLLAANMQAVLSGYIALLKQNANSVSFGAEIPLPSTTDIETNYYHAAINVGANPVSAIDLSIAVLSKDTGAPSWYNLPYIGVSLDAARIGSPSAVLDNISIALASEHFLATSYLVYVAQFYSLPSNAATFLLGSQDRPFADQMASILRATEPADVRESVDVTLGGRLARALTNPSLGRALGYQSSQGASAALKMMASIAYSSLNSNKQSPISSLYDDAQAIGELASSDNFSGPLGAANVISALAEIAVQYAGDQAKNNLSQGSGAISFNDNYLTINLDPSKWVSSFNTTPANSTTSDIVGLADLVNAVFANFATIYQVSGGTLGWIENVAKGDASFTKQLDQTTLVEASLDGNDLSGTSAATTKDANGNSVPGGAFLIGQIGTGTITGTAHGNDIIVGGATITTGTGNDFILTSKYKNSGELTTFNFGGGNNRVFADPPGGVNDSFNYSSSSGSELIIGDAQGGDTFTFNNADKAAFTVVWGGTGNDTFNIDAAKSANADVLMLNMSGITSSNISDLDMSKLETYIHKTYQLSADTPTIVLLDPTSNDTLKYNGETVISPSVSQFSDAFNDGYSSFADYSNAALNQANERGVDNIWIDDAYVGSTGTGQYLATTAIYTDLTNELNPGVGPWPTAANQPIFNNYANEPNAWSYSVDETKTNMLSANNMDYGYSDVTTGQGQTSSGGTGSTYTQNPPEQTSPSITFPVLTLSDITGSLQPVDNYGALGAGDAQGWGVLGYYGYDLSKSSQTPLASGGLSLLNFQPGEFGVEFNGNGPQYTDTRSTTTYGVTKWAEAALIGPEALYSGEYPNFVPAPNYLGEVFGEAPVALGQEIADRTTSPQTTDSQAQLVDVSGATAPTVSINDFLLSGSDSHENGGGGGGNGGGGNPPVVNVQDFTANQSALDSLPGGFAVDDTAVNISSAIDDLSGDPNVTAISMTDGGTPALSLSASQVANDSATLDEITNASYAIQVTDTSASVSQNLDALEANAKVDAITLTDSGTPTLALTAAQALGDSTALGEITNSDYNISISDTATEVSAGIDALNGDAKVSLIALTDNGTPTLDLTVAQALDDSTALGEISGANYAIAINDSAANVLNNATALQADAKVASVTVVDSAASVLANSSALTADLQVASITVVDTAANMLANETALADNSQVASEIVVDVATNVLADASALASDAKVTTIVVSDSSANVAVNIDALNGDTSVKAIALTDSGTPTLTLTVAQATEDATALGEIENANYAIAISDTTADVGANIDALNSDTKISSITLIDGGTPVLSLTAAQAVDDSASLGMVTNANLVVNISDTAANVAANLDALNGNSKIGSITLTDSGAPTLALSVAQSLADSSALGKIANNNYSITVTDSAIDVSAYLDALNADVRISSINLTDSGTPTLELTVAQALGDATALGDISNANYAIAIYDTVANVLENSAAVGADTRIVSTTIVDTVANILPSEAQIDADPQIGAVTIVDTAANVSANIDALNGVVNLAAVMLTDDGAPSLDLTVAQALNDGGVLGRIVNADYTIAISDSAANVAANIDTLNADDAIASVTLTDSGAPTLLLSAVQAVADSDILSKIANADYKISVSDNAEDVVGQAAALDANARITSINITDSAVDISSDIDALAGVTALSSITLTDGGTPTLSLTAGQTLGDSSVLSKITGGNYAVAIADCAANILSDENALASQPNISSVTVIDTAANIVANAAALESDTQITSIVVVDNAANTLANASALSEIPGATVRVVDTAGDIVSNSSALSVDSQVSTEAIVDTSADIAANLAGLDSDWQISSITLTDTPILTVCVVQAFEAWKLGEVGANYGLNIADSAANISANLANFVDVSNIASITLTDSGTPMLSLNVADIINEQYLLAVITNTNYQIAISDTAANVSANFDTLAANANCAAITLTDSGTPNLNLTVSQALDDTGTLVKLTNSAYSIAISDSAENVLANAAALQADSLIISINVVDNASTIVAQSAALSNNAQISEITVVDTAANVLANSAALAANGQVTSIDVVDTAANVSADIDALNGVTKLSSIALSDDGPLTLTAAQALDDTRALDAIPGFGLVVNIVDNAADVANNLSALDADSAIGSVTVTDTLANIQANMAAFSASPMEIAFSVESGSVASVAEFLASQATLDGSGGFTIEDTANNVTSSIAALNADSYIESVTLSDSGTPTLTLSVADALGDTRVLTEITNTTYGVAVSDTASNVSENLDALNDDSQISSITLTDSGTPTLTLTVAEALDDTSALHLITNSTYAVAIFDTAENVAASINQLEADSQIASITLTDGGTPTLTLTVAQTLGDASALERITNSTYAIAISDTAANVAASIDQLNAIAQIASITFTDSGAPTFALTAEQTVADAVTLAKITNANFEVLVASAGSEPSGTVEIAGLNDVVSIGASSLSFLDGVSATVTGDNDSILLNNGDDVAITGSADAASIGGNGDTVSISSSSVTFANGASATVNGSSDSIQLGSSDDTTVTGSGDAVTIDGTETTVSIDSGSLTLANNSNATISGSNDSISLGSCDAITITGANDTIVVQGAGDTIDVSSGSVNVATDDISATVGGMGNTVSLVAGDDLTLTGTNETVAASGGGDDVVMQDAGDNVTMDNGWGSVWGNIAALVSGTGDNIYVDTGDTLTVTGSGNTVTAGGTNDTIAISSGSVDVVTDNISTTVGGTGNSISIGAGDDLTLTGTDETVTAGGGGDDVVMEYAGDSVTMDNGWGSVWGNIAASVSGTGDNIYVDTGDALTVIGSGNTVTAGGTNDTIAISSGSVDVVTDNISTTVGGTGNSISIGAGDDLNLTGTNDTVTGIGSGDTVTADGTNDTVNISSGSVTLANANISATVGGDGNSISIGAGDDLTLTGTSETVTASGGGDDVVMQDAGDNVTMDNGWGSVWGNIAASVSGTGDNIYVDTGDTLTVTGSGDTVTAGGTGNAISMSSGTLDLIGALTTVSGNNNAIIISANNSVTVTGADESYSFGSGGGQSEIGAASGTNTGTANFNSGINDENLWFQHVGNNLQVDLMGSNDELTVDNWFGGSNSAAVQGFATTDGLKLDTQVGQLVAAMATYAANNPSFNPTAVSQAPNDATLQNAIAAAWHN